MKEPEEYKWKGIKHLVRTINSLRSFMLANVLKAGNGIAIDEDSNHSKTISTTGAGGSGGTTETFTVPHLGEKSYIDVCVKGTFREEP